MKIRNHFLTFILTVVSVSMFFSCNDLDLHYEGGTFDDEQIKEVIAINPERLSATVNGMYAILGKPNGFYGSGRADDFGYPTMSLSQDLNSGDMTNIVSGYDWFSVSLEWTDRSPTYANPRMRFGIPYKIVNAVQDVLSSIPDDTDKPDLIYNRGQARAMRGFAYLSLAPFFQYKYKGNEDKPSVPIVADDVDFRCNPRVPLRELYEYIIGELTAAIADLDGFSRSNKGLIDQKVAYGLRARAYLYMEDWANAAADADRAMQGYTPYAMSELTSPGFNNANDHAWIWGLLLPADIIGTTLLSWPSQLGSFSGESYVAYAGIYRSINVLLWNKIPSTDIRRRWWLDENQTSPYLEGLTWRDIDQGITYTGQEIAGASIPDVKQPMEAFANIKFGQRSGVGSPYNDGDWCMMRTEEMILIKAEATAKGGNLAGGKQILEDFVKTYRNPAFTSTAASVEDFSNEVWLQRRIELWGEGFAMADVMRLGKNVVRYHPGEESNVDEVYQFNLASNDGWLLLRFAQAEITNNACCDQNEGGTEPKQGDGANLKDGVTD